MLILLLLKNLIKNFLKLNQLDFIKKILSKKLKQNLFLLVIILDLEIKEKEDVKQLIKYEKKYNYKIIKPKPLN
jgi:riboflavin kinase/FMN adenylyltransferase